MTDKPHESHMIAANALIAKRADILFEIAKAEKHIEQLRGELVHVDIVLRMFRPDLPSEGLRARHRRPSKSPYFGHGELTQRIYNTFRENPIITSLDVAVAAMRDKGLNPETDVRTRIDFVKRIARVLTDMRQADKIERVGRGKPARWQLKGSL